MKHLKRKSEITSKNLRDQDCNYRGSKLGFDKTEQLYFIGSWFNESKIYFNSVDELKTII